MQAFITIKIGATRNPAIVANGCIAALAVMPALQCADLTNERSGVRQRFRESLSYIYSHIVNNTCEKNRLIL